MEFRVLRYFLTVAREENITRAAELLFITQPTLSRQLQQLEEQLGTQLIVRGKRKIVLTEAGMLLRHRAKEIVSLVEKTEDELQEYSTKINGQVFIGIPESAAGQQIIELLKGFQDRFPEATYDIYTGTADMVKERMDKGLIDIGLLIEPADIEKYDYIPMKQKEKWGILLPKDAPLAAQENVILKDIRDAPLLISKRYKRVKQLSEWFGKDIERLNIVATFNLTTNASIMVKNNMGYATVVGGSFLGESENSICFRPLFPEVYSNSILAWRKYQVFSPTVTKFIEHVKNYISNDERIR